MNDLLNDITHYMDYLITEQNLFLSLHGEFAQYPELARYNFHTHPYCQFIKINCEKWDVCKNRQHKVFARCQEGAFWGTCYTGMGEYVLPIHRNKELVGFLSVSGYRLPDTDGKAKHFCESYKMNYAKLSDNQKTLSTPPTTEHLDTLLAPLHHMLQWASRHSLKSQDNNLYTQLIRYIAENNSRNISMNELTEKFHFSASTLSHTFRKHSGYSIQEYCNILRINSAQWLLISTDISVTQIASMLGYCTANYFSDAFKKHTGLSPLQYRKLHKANR